MVIPNMPGWVVRGQEGKPSSFSGAAGVPSGDREAWRPKWLILSPSQITELPPSQMAHLGNSYSPLSCLRALWRSAAEFSRGRQLGGVSHFFSWFSSREQESLEMENKFLHLLLLQQHEKAKLKGEELGRWWILPQPPPQNQPSLKLNFKPRYTSSSQPGPYCTEGAFQVRKMTSQFSSLSIIWSRSHMNLYHVRYQDDQSS